MKRRGFTLIEMLVTVTIIAILSSVMYGALLLARKSAHESATKATIAKLNTIIMRRYESYMTRRVPIRIPPGTSPRDAARMRLDAIRDLMRMEMPDARSDIVNGPITTFDWGGLPTAPALHRVYAASPPTADHDAAQCLYMIVSRGNPEAMEQFNQREIGTVDGRPVFVDGWRRPIMFLRWAPGYTSPIQSGDEEKDHDPFDTRGVDGFAFHMVPLIYSAGADGKYDLNLVAGYVFNGNPYEDMNLGRPTDIDGDGPNHHDNITNHSIEMR